MTQPTHQKSASRVAGLQVHATTFNILYTQYFLLWWKTLRSLSGCCWDSPWQHNVKHFDKFCFWFPSHIVDWLLLRMLSHTYKYFPTSLVSQLYICSTSFLAYGIFLKVVQLFKNFPTVYSSTIFEKKSNFMRPRIQKLPFWFFSSSWSYIHLHYGYNLKTIYTLL